jgi:hypothetical protein
VGASGKSRRLIDRAEQLIIQSLGEDNRYCMAIRASRVSLLPSIELGVADSARKKLEALRQCINLIERKYPPSHFWSIELRLMIAEILLNATGAATA